MDATQLAEVITANSPIPKEVVSQAILSQIQQGGLKSKQLAKEYKEALTAFLNSSS